MPSQREIRRRIGAVKNIRQITRAMQFVAASKLKRAQESTLAARPYGTSIDEVIADLAAVLGVEGHPLLRTPESGAPRTIVLFTTGNPDPGPIAMAYLGTILLSGCYLSFGLLFSAMTENQIIAGALTFAFGLFFWLVGWATQSVGSTWGDTLDYLSLINHYNNFSQGMLNSTDIVFYLSFIFLGLFLTHRVLDSFRWR